MILIAHFCHLNTCHCLFILLHPRPQYNMLSMDIGMMNIYKLSNVDYLRTILALHNIPIPLDTLLRVFFIYRVKPFSLSSDSRMTPRKVVVATLFI